jgi:hypothetical protein
MKVTWNDFRKNKVTQKLYEGHTKVA